ncbi:DUF3794 domain-containing protein [Clostridium fungisolvens]|uniref:SipL SPOCS domain-containing protein n=1 Tax=Clostridium fungisolvens TaxID=1604897 RepID=A0A6V8SB73_9CLOT|nr:DUF3794 domain-containing protein [Clostridium fungisolvens]GFP74494.1 hypothetical protein bsdtw1_00546 [Clostridium fungisolvens]
MDSNVKNLVEGIGIATSFPEDPKYFTQLSIPETLIIPKPKPDMEQLLSVAVEAVVESTKLIETPIALSNEGQNLSGCKLIVEIKLREKVKYVADEPTQTVHAAHYENVLRSVFIIVPCEVNGQPVRNLLSRKKVVVTPYIEDIYAEMVDARTIFKNITIFVNVKFLSCTSNP